ncbi:MAG: hypothetical protein B9S32_17050 [Verrucomicrobia bacterium Tous-C9LFEB]|nr:MAG: hypothetical protein B9S32_17050 [Verrucomicrobia bacterium Tous-C9LFEB]
MRLACLLSFLFVSGLGATHAAESSTPANWPDAATFTTPSAQYGVETWWHWLNGNLSKEGVTKDLQAMREQGIPRATILAVSMASDGPVSPFLSDQWFELWRYTAEEANRIGVKLSTHLGPGWSATGGPWIKPENSMKRVVWSHEIITGGQTVDLDLPPLPATQNWSKDIAVLAWPVNRTPSSMAGCTAQSNGQSLPSQLFFDGNPATGAETEETTKWRFDFTFPAPHEFNRAEFFIRWKVHEPPGNKIRLLVTADGSVPYETEIIGHEFNNALAIPFPTIKATKITLEWEILGPVEGWLTFRNVQMSEVELLKGTEAPQWSCELLNLAQQTADSSSPGTPNWVKGESFPIQAAQVIDLTSQTKNGHLNWNAPAGTWRVVRFGFTTTGKGSSVPPTAGKGLESDKMSVAATDLHFKSYIQRLIDAIPAAQRGVLDTVLLDSWEVGRQNWTDDFAEEFQRRRHYALLPYLSVFAGEVLGSREETERFLNDFRETIADLITERFFGRNAELLHARKIEFAAELSDSAPPSLDLFAIARLVDQPMDEFWSDKPDLTIPPPPDEAPRKSAVPEAAFVAGKPVVGAEAFTSWTADYRRTPGDYGYLGDHALLWGFNRLVLHSYVHQPADKAPGWTLGRHGQAFNRLITWWPMIGDWLREISRSQYLLQTSAPVYDVLIYYGDSMPRPGPGSLKLPAGARSLRIDRVALNQLKVVDGKLTLHGTDRYHALLVPSNRLRAETVETLARLAQDGAIIAASRPGKAPGWSDHVEQDRRIEATALSVWGTARAIPSPKNVGKGKLYAPGDTEKLFREIGYRPDFSSAVVGDLKPLMSQHRRAGAVELYALFNPNPKAARFTTTVAASSPRSAEIWDPITGQHQPLGEFQSSPDSVTFSLAVEGRRTLYVILSPGTAASATASVAASAPAQVFPIVSPFTVTFKGLPGIPAQPLQPPQSWTELTDPQIRDYSGIALYQTNFTLPADFPITGAITLDLGDVARVARVTLNGQRLGTLWRAPWRLEVSKAVRAGGNSLQIEVANTWFNRLLADEALPKADRLTFTTWDRKAWIDQKLTREKSGLLGPIQLEAQPDSRKKQ